MAVDERRRHEMYLSLERTLGREAADSLMEHLPPVGWAEVATKSDLEVLGAATKAGLAGLREAMDAGFEGAALRLESTNSSMLAEMHRSLRNQAIAMMTVFGILHGVVFAALKLA